MSRRLAWFASFFAVALIGVTWAYLIPLGGQPDEPAHAVKAAAVVRGELTWDSRVDVISTDPKQVTHSEMVLQAPEGYDLLGARAYCIARPPMQDASCAPPVSASTRSIDVANTYTAAYPPTVYLVMGLPTLWMTPSAAIQTMRLVMVTLCAIFLAGAFSLAATRSGTRRALLVGVLLAATPMALFLSSAPNPNALEVATAICAATALFVLLCDRGRSTASEMDPPSIDQRDIDKPHTDRPGIDRAALAWFTIAAVVLALTRPTSLLVLGFAIFWIVAAFATRTAVGRLLAHGWVRASAGLVAISVGLAAWWIWFANPLDAVVGFPHPGHALGENIKDSLGRLPSRAAELIGRFGWGDTDAPHLVQAGWLVLVALLVVAALAVGTWRHRAVLLALLVAIVILPTAAELPRVDELGFIWFGRYWLPFAITVPIVAGGILSVSPTTARLLTRPWRRRAAVVVILFAGAAQFGSMAAGASRFAVGKTTDALAFFHDPRWSPEIGAGGSLALIVASSVLYTLVMGYLAIGARTRHDRGPTSLRARGDSSPTSKLESEVASVS